MSTSQPHDPVIFVNWYLQSVNGGEFDPELTFSGSVFWTHECEDNEILEYTKSTFCIQSSIP
jgi:hypothetical protein